MGRPRTSPLSTLAVTLMAAGAALSLRRPASTLVRSWAARIAIEGGSMAPTLLAGDWVLVDPDAYRRRRPRVGELVLVSDPRRADRLLVKRVRGVTAEGGLEVVGDAPHASTDSRSFGAVDPADVSGRPWLRYWPPRRIGPLR